MNAFFEHHQHSIKFFYGCFDRILLNGCIQSFLDGARVKGFFYIAISILSVAMSCARWPATITTGSRATPRSAAWRSSRTRGAVATNSSNRTLIMPDQIRLW